MPYLDLSWIGGAWVPQVCQSLGAFENFRWALPL